MTTKTTIYQDLESATCFSDCWKLRDRIMAETTGDEQRGYLKSLDCLENVLDEMAALHECKMEQESEAYIARNFDECGNPIW